MIPRERSRFNHRVNKPEERVGKEEEEEKEGRAELWLGEERGADLSKGLQDQDPSVSSGLNAS